MTIHKLRRGGAVGVLAAAALLAGAVPAVAAPGDGSAYAAQVNLLGTSIGPLAMANTNGPTSNSLLSLPGGAVSLGVMTTSAVHDEATGEVNASAETANLGINLALLSASAEAITATCTATQAGITGTSRLLAASVAGMALPVDPAPNTRLDIPGSSLPLVPSVQLATLVLNEQIQNADGSLTVNAFHLTLLDGTADIVISSVTCGPATPPIPLASGLGLWISLGLIGLAAIPVGWVVIRRRRLTMAA